MRDAVDLKSWQSERREAAGVPIDVGDGGPLIVVDPFDLWPDDRSDAEKFIEGIVGGHDNWERFVAAGGNYATLVKLVTGTDDVGESEGSSGTSKTGISDEPSTQTSPGSTD